MTSHLLLPRPLSMRTSGRPGRVQHPVLRVVQSTTGRVTEVPLSKSDLQTLIKQATAMLRKLDKAEAAS